MSRTWSGPVRERKSVTKYVEFPQPETVAPTTTWFPLLNGALTEMEHAAAAGEAGRITAAVPMRTLAADTAAHLRRVIPGV
ncbi:hypothetical protein GCM10010468_39030 [Actinocorallia longicatena]|uniref:Uncharacterized protein n=1 Tax=Actinocorallia longicatena TaxID=111803 RepID=A0ABP6QCU3_9ACTN